MKRGNEQINARRKLILLFYYYYLYKGWPGVGGEWVVQITKYKSGAHQTLSGGIAQESSGVYTYKWARLSAKTQFTIKFLMHAEKNIYSTR